MNEHAQTLYNSIFNLVKTYEIKINRDPKLANIIVELIADIKRRFEKETKQELYLSIITENKSLIKKVNNAVSKTKNSNK